MGETPLGNCGCIVIGAVVGLAVAAAMVALGLYATNVVETGLGVK
jgi:uncharacterized membrane protein